MPKSDFNKVAKNLIYSEYFDFLTSLNGKMDFILPPLILNPLHICCLDRNFFDLLLYTISNLSVRISLENMNKYGGNLIFNEY